MAGAFLLALFSGFGQTFFISLFNDELREHFQLTVGQFGLLYMFATLVSSAIFLNIGSLVDRYSVASISAGTLFAVGVACSLMVLNASFGQGTVWGMVGLAITLFTLRLFGQGMLLHASQTAIGRWFDAERGKAIALTSLGLNVGEAIFPLAVWGLSAWFEWQISWGIASVAAFVGIPVCYALTRIPRQPESEPSEESSGLIRKQWTRAEVLRDVLFWFACPGCLAPAFIATAIYFHHQHVETVKHWPAGSFASAFALLSVATVLSKLVFGSVIDRFGAIRLIWTYHLPLGASCLMLAFGQSALCVYPAMALIGVAMGGANSIFGTVWPELYGVTHLGSIRSIAVSGIVFASACGSGVTGALIDGGLGFETQLLLMGGWCLVSTILLWFVSGQMHVRRMSE